MTFIFTLVLSTLIALGRADLLDEYNQLGSKLVGGGYDSRQDPSGAGWSVSVSADSTILAVGGPLHNGGAGATWVFISDGKSYEQLGSELVGTEAIGSSSQGFSVSLTFNGRILAVGGPDDNKGIGAVWIFISDGSTFQQCGSKLVGTQAWGNARQGASVSLSSDGQFLAVGGPSNKDGLGATWIFRYDGSTYQQFGDNLVGANSSAYSSQGHSVSLSFDGRVLAVGGPSDNASEGAAWIFKFDGSTYQQIGSKLVGVGSSGISRKGNSVSLSSNGSIIAVGGPIDNTDVGATWIFQYDGLTYQQVGEKLVGGFCIGSLCIPSGIAHQGRSVSLSSDGRILAVSGNLDFYGIGGAWVFVSDGTTYQQLGNKLLGTDGSASSWQGLSVSLSSDGSILAMGGNGDNNYMGATWVFGLDGGTYQQRGNKLVAASALGDQGQSVSLSSDGHMLAVGGPSDKMGIGATWLFKYDGSTFQQIGDKIIGIGSSGGPRKGSGVSVSLSSDGSVLAVGGPWDNGANGATWIFRRDGSTFQRVGKKIVGKGTEGFANTGASGQGESVSLSQDGSILAVGGPITQDDKGAAWIFKYDNSTYQEVGNKLVGIGASSTSGQGSSVSLSSDGHFLAVGAQHDNSDTGATWVFTSHGSTYKQLGKKLVGNDISGSPQQGHSVSLSSDGLILAVGGYNDNDGIGASWIFQYDGWKYRQLGNKLVGNETGGSKSLQGYSVSLSSDGRVLAVGGIYGYGATWIFKYDGATYQQFGHKLVGTQTWGYSYQGYSVSVSSDGNIVAVGGPGDHNFVGATWIFQYDGSSYQQLGNKLLGNDTLGSPWQGFSVSLSSDGRALAVGGPFDDNEVGAAWMFNFDGSTYQQVGSKFVPPCPSQQGYSVSLSSDGRKLAVGGPRDNNQIGATWTFILDGSRVRQLGNKLVGTNALGGSQQGYSVSLSSDGGILAVGSPYDNNWVGATWIFVFDESTGTYNQWGGKLFDAGSAGSSPRQGWSVSLSSGGNILAIGSPFDSDGIGATWIYVYNGAMGTYDPLMDKLVGSGYVVPSKQGWSVSLSSDGSILAVGGPFDGPDYAYQVGSTWLFEFNGSTYNQLGGGKLVGKKYLGYSSQGASVSLSSDGSVLAVGGYSDTFGFTPDQDVLEGYIVTLKGIGATWIFSRDGQVYRQSGIKLVGTGYIGDFSKQGNAVSLSGNGTTLAVGGPGDDSTIGATWIFSTTAPPPQPPQLHRCLKPCFITYAVDRLVCRQDAVLLLKRSCVIMAKIRRRECVYLALKDFQPFVCYIEEKNRYNDANVKYKAVWDGSCACQGNHIFCTLLATVLDLPFNVIINILEKVVVRLLL